MLLQEETRNVPTLSHSSSSKDVTKNCCRRTLIHHCPALKADFLPINTLISRRSPSGNLENTHNHYLLCTYPQTFESEPLPLPSSCHYVIRSNKPPRKPRITENTRVQADMESQFLFQSWPTTSLDIHVQENLGIQVCV